LKGNGSLIYVVALQAILTPFAVITGIIDNISGTEKMLRQELKNQGKDHNI